MTNSIFIDNVRKIALTNDILKRLPQIPPDKDKGRILGNRGVGVTTTSTVFNPCQSLYSDADGTFTFADLVDGVAGPKLQDGTYNHCDQVNTITGIKEVNDLRSVKQIRLKPDGMVLADAASVASGYWYTTDLLLSTVITDSDFDQPLTGASENQWAFNTPQEALDFTIATREFTLPGFISHTSSALTATTVTDVDISGYNWSTAYPLYFYVTSDLASPPTAYDMNGYLYGIPYNYDFRLDDHGSGLPVHVEVPIIDNPPPAPSVFANMDTFQVFETNFGTYDPPFPLQVPTTFQLYIDSTSGLWKPDPATLSITPLKYHNGVSIVSFYFGTTFTRTGEVHPAKDGGFMLYEVSAPGVPINNVYVYRHDRTLSAVIPASQVHAYYP